MTPYYSGNFGNPSSLHSFGRQAKRAVDPARGIIASLIGANEEEIIFTSIGSAAVTEKCLVGNIIIIRHRQVFCGVCTYAAAVVDVPVFVIRCHIGKPDAAIAVLTFHAAVFRAHVMRNINRFLEIIGHQFGKSVYFFPIPVAEV